MERRLVPVARPVAARLVPTGEPIDIEAGKFVTLTQALGGTYTVVVDGNMARIEGEDADALGFEPETLTFDPPADGAPDFEQVRTALASVHDPEIPVNIVDLGLVYACKLDGDTVRIEMTLTTPGCPVAEDIPVWIRDAVSTVEGAKDVAVDIVWDPPWDPSMMSDYARIELGFY